MARRANSGFCMIALQVELLWCPQSWVAAAEHWIFCCHTVSSYSFWSHLTWAAAGHDGLLSQLCCFLLQGVLDTASSNRWHWENSNCCHHELGCLFGTWTLLALLERSAFPSKKVDSRACRRLSPWSHHPVLQQVWTQSLNQRSFQSCRPRSCWPHCRDCQLAY